MTCTVKQLKFTKRPLSWAAVTSECFYKVPRNSNSLKADLDDSTCIEEASKEYELTCYLSEQDDAVNKPLKIDGACIEYPLLSGPDMIEFIKSEKDNTVVQKGIESVVSLLGRLHQKSIDISVFHIHNYGQDTFLSADYELMSRISSRKKSIVIDGFEVRNFRFDKSKGQWIFFDPHNIRQGLPEEDFARFVVSLLMANWGRNHICKIWRNFNFKALIYAYEDSAPSKLDRQLLRYAFGLVLGMRRHYAMKAVRAMGGLQRMLARVYLEVYFNQMNKWVEKHGVSV